MRQRVMIAMAVSCNPKLIIADEPTTALDMTIQAQILELMQGLSTELGTAMILITHNLGVVARYAKRVIVMYAGSIIEEGTARQIYYDPRHPYGSCVVPDWTKWKGQAAPRLPPNRRLGRLQFAEVPDGSVPHRAPVLKR